MSEPLLVAAIVAIALVIAISGVFAVRGSLSRTRKTARWGDVAARHGLDFVADYGMPGIRGRLDGHFVRVKTVIIREPWVGTAYRTRIEARFLEPLGLGLSLRRSGALQGGARLVGLRGIELRDAAFDRTVQVRGTPEEEVRRYLDTARRRQVEELFEHLPAARVGDGGISVELRRIPDAEELDASLQALVSTAKALSR